MQFYLNHCDSDYLLYHVEEFGCCNGWTRKVNMHAMIRYILLTLQTSKCKVFQMFGHP